MNNRHISILMAFLPGVYMLLVVFNNVFDYQSNFIFLGNVASMTEVFSGDVNRWRAIQVPVLHHVIYSLVIGWELLTACLLVYGTLQMWKHRLAAKPFFHSSKKFVLLGLCMGIVLWFTAFITVAGEWFLMWQSSKWNGSHTAFFLSGIFLLFLLHQRTAED